jgi:tRNA A37 methylthiotransferase MiaB
VRINHGLEGFHKKLRMLLQLADGEVLAGCLTEAGFQLATSETESDLIIYNTCAVKGPTENRIINALKNTPKDKKIVIAGCLPKISFERLCREAHFDSAVGPAVGKEIGTGEACFGWREKIVDLNTVGETATEPSWYKSTRRSVVPVNFGCLGSCPIVAWFLPTSAELWNQRNCRAL